MAHSDREGDTSQTDVLTISNWMVSFLDMMGYGTVLHRLDTEINDSTSALLIETIRTVVNRRALFMRGINTVVAAASGQSDRPAIVQLAGQEGITLQHAQAWMQPKVLCEEGGDHVVLSCSLASIAGYSSLVGVYYLFVASSTAMLIQLASGADEAHPLPLRGGIHVAPGLVWPDDKHLYSAARSGAYFLESKCAKSPRTIVSERVVDLLHSHAAANSHNIREQVNAMTAQKLKRYLFKEGNHHVLDFFGHEASQLVQQSNVGRDLGVRAWRCATRNLERARSTPRDEKIEKYWADLVEYMKPRLHYWRGPVWKR